MWYRGGVFPGGVCLGASTLEGYLPGGGVYPGGWPNEMAPAVVSTHPTGMHSCAIFVLSLKDS